MEVTAANSTLPDVSPKGPAAGLQHVYYYVLTAVALATLMGSLVAVVLYFRQKARSRLDDLRHRLLPLYTYDPTEQEEDWGDEERGEEEQLVPKHTMESRERERRYLVSVLLLLGGAVLVLPSRSMAADTLLCHYCPMQHKRESCSGTGTNGTGTGTMTTRCLAGERCASSRGRYGGVHVLSAQGCVAAELCGARDLVWTHLGTRYDVSHACCCEDRCNHAPRPEAAHLSTTLLLLLAGSRASMDVNSGNEDGNDDDVIEEPRDSCVNYTSSGGATKSELMMAVAVGSPRRPSASEALAAALLWLWLLPRPLLGDNLTCFYSPLLERESAGQYRPVATECPPHQLCYKGRGRYGNHSALSERGCLEAEGCDQEREFSLKGTAYVLSYTCCSLPYCNAASSVGSPALPLAAALLAGMVARL
ncbi:unnamed protein product [Merluccius merluccius]